MIGEACALGAALCWALATFVFGRSGRRLSALQLNVAKGVIALAILLASALALEDGGWPARRGPVLLLALSGVVGITVGDSAFFAALKAIGARKTLLLEALAPPLAGMISLLVLGEAVGGVQWLGIFLTIAGVSWVVVEKQEERTAVPATRAGVVYGVVAAFCQAAGVVMTHAVLVEHESSPLWSAITRLGAGTAGVALWLLLGDRRQLRGLGKAFLRGRIPRWRFTGAVFLGTYLAIWLQQLSLQLTHPAIAQTLMSTGPLFIIPVVVVAGERVSWRSICGTAVAVGGVVLLFLW